MTPLVADGCSQCPLEIKETTLVFYSDVLNFYIQIFPGRFDRQYPHQVDGGSIQSYDSLGGGEGA